MSSKTNAEPSSDFANSSSFLFPRLIRAFRKNGAAWPGSRSSSGDEEVIMKAQSQRQLRAGELVRRTVADIIREGDMHDPIIASGAVTITEARISPDLRYATVYVDILGAGDREQAVNVLNKAAGFIQRELGRRTELKFTPRLRFAVDDRQDEVKSVEALLDRPSVKRDLDKQGEA